MCGVVTGAYWDAGELGCGELLVALKSRLSALPVGCAIALVAQDAGAREDLPSWCRLTGNRLIEADPPHYLIQRREEG